MDDMTFNDLMKKLAIAVSGGIATGKSTVCSYLSQKGFLVVDADELAKQVVLPGTDGYHEIKNIFGEKAIRQNGIIDRVYLRNLIFSDPNEKTKLEAIVHPKIKKAHKALVEKFFDKSSPQIWFYAAALIFEKQLAAEFKEVWLIDCPEKVQIERLMKRDHISEEDAVKAIAAQMPRAERIKRASIVINSDCSPEQLKQQIDFKLDKVSNYKSKGT